MKKLILTMAIAVIASLSYSQTFRIDGRIENTKGKTHVVLYEYSGTKWDTAYIGYFRKFLWFTPHYSLILDRDYNYQIWYTNPLDSVKVLAVDKQATKAKRIIVDVDFSLKDNARVTSGHRPFQLVFVKGRMTVASRPEDFDKLLIKRK